VTRLGCLVIVEMCVRGPVLVYIVTAYAHPHAVVSSKFQMSCMLCRPRWSLSQPVSHSLLSAKECACVDIWPGCEHL
jgi:hypothetical protein